MSTKRIHALASQPQYLRHILPIWSKLDPSVQGELLTGRNATTRNIPHRDTVLVGGFYDIDRVPENWIVYVEHGAGQSYNGDPTTVGHPAYHGGWHPTYVIGYVCPREDVAARWGRPAVAVGCPALDEHDQWRPTRFESRPVAAVTFHWDARRVCPEAWSAREWYLDELHNMIGHLRSCGFEVIGTRHPRDERGQEIWRNLQVDYVEDPDEVLRVAHLLVADNTSLQYEAAKLGITQAVLNAPWYRREVEHGLRFWSHVPGRMVEEAREFMLTDWKVVLNGEKSHLVARAAGDYAFPGQLGRAGEEAARWIEKLVDERT